MFWSDYKSSWIENESLKELFEQILLSIKPFIFRPFFDLFTVG